MSGKKMQKFFMTILAVALLAGPAFARQQWTSPAARLKARQKLEAHALKLKQAYMKSSIRNSNLPKAVRIQLKHELKREQRRLRQKQKDERQALKDQERLFKLEMKELESQ